MTGRETLDVVVRDMWTQDRLNDRVPGVRLFPEEGGFPWALVQPQGDVWRFHSVVIEDELLYMLRADTRTLIETCDQRVVEALDWLRSMHLSTSEALEAGEMRRCVRRG